MATVESIKNMKKKRHRGIGLKFFMSVILLAVISVVAAVLITNHGKLDMEGFKRLFGSSDGTTQTTEFIFDTGSEVDVASFDGGLAVASTIGLQVFDCYSELAFSESVHFSTPTVCTSGKSGVAYDLGGYSLKLFDTSGIIKSITTTEKIISARLNSNGWLTLCTQEDGYKGFVTVYNASGSEEYYWHSAKGYTLSAEISSNNKKLAVLTLMEDGSRIVFFELDSIDETASVTLPGTLVSDMVYINTDAVLAVSEDELCIIHSDGSIETQFEFSGRYLTGYTLDSGKFSALLLKDYLVGDQGSIVAIDRAGKTLGTLSTDQKVLSMSASGDYLAVLFSDGLVIYDKNLEEYAHYDDTLGAVGTIMQSDGTALCVSAHSAAVKDAAAG